MWRRRTDWFSELLGFEEDSYHEAKSNLEVLSDDSVPGMDCKLLRSKVTGRRFGAGCLELVGLATLRERVRLCGGLPGALKVSVIQREAREMHKEPQFANALIQVASQFNLLEMVGNGVTPERGVTGYAYDATQGPACAIACGAGTVFRNYCAPVARGQFGQTHDNQLDGIFEMGQLLSAKLGRPLEQLWSMENGYCMCTEAGLQAIAGLLDTATAAELDEFRSALRIGVHSHVQVTDGVNFDDKPVFVSQAYCSALPVSYCWHHHAPWGAFATLVLEAAYEATLLAGILNAKQFGSNVVLLTCVGGGAFGNSATWIETAMKRAFAVLSDQALDVRIVTYGRPDNWLLELEESVRRSSAVGSFNDGE